MHSISFSLKLFDIVILELNDDTQIIGEVINRIVRYKSTSVNVLLTCQSWSPGAVDLWSNRPTHAGVRPYSTYSVTSGVHDRAVAAAGSKLVFANLCFTPMHCSSCAH